MSEDLEFGVSINPNFIPNDKEGISDSGWLSRINSGLVKYNLRVREKLYCVGDIKMMLCGTYDNIKEFLMDIYGYVDYSSIYLWDARCIGLVHYFKTRPRGDLEIWRCL